MKLIDVRTLKEYVENWFTKNRLYHPYAKNNNIPTTELYDILELIPSEDVAKVVRCKDCKYRYLDEDFGLKCKFDSYDPYEANRKADDDNWYCADGKRK